jgi:CRP/FNR family transcriptional regulator, cyclic AMP receptor protein
MSLLKISESWVRRKYAEKQIIIYAGDQVNHFFYLEKGYVKVYTITEDGEERILLILKPGDLFPLLRDPARPGQSSLYFHVAMVDVELSVIDQLELLKQLKNDHQAAWELLSYTSKFSSILTSRLAQLESKTAEEKLSNLLSYLISVCGKKIQPHTYFLDLKLTHQDIANLIGVTRETASVTLKQLTSQNRIGHENGHLIINKSGLDLR